MNKINIIEIIIYYVIMLPLNQCKPYTVLLFISQ